MQKMYIFWKALTNSYMFYNDLCWFYTTKEVFEFYSQLAVTTPSSVQWSDAAQREIILNVKVLLWMFIISNRHSAQVSLVIWHHISATSIWKQELMIKAQLRKVEKWEEEKEKPKESERTRVVKPIESSITHRIKRLTFLLMASLSLSVGVYLLPFISFSYTIKRYGIFLILWL